MLPGTSSHLFDDATPAISYMWGKECTFARRTVEFVSRATFLATVRDGVWRIYLLGIAIPLHQYCLLQPITPLDQLRLRGHVNGHVHGHDPHESSLQLKKAMYSVVMSVITHPNSTIQSPLLPKLNQYTKSSDYT